MGMDFRHEFSWPANVVGLLRAKFQGEDFEMSIEHKLEPIEHWIVDGKAYRLATEEDIGKEVSSTDHEIGKGGCTDAVGKLNGIDRTTELPFSSRGTYWRYAYIQDDSLLAPQRTPVPALGDGWFLLKDNEVLRYSDKVTVYEDMSRGWVDAEELEGKDVAFWRERTPGNRAARYFGPTKEPQLVAEPELKPKPIDWTKPVRTKDGRAVRVLCTDGPGEYPVAGYVEYETNPRSWTLSGYFHINERHSTLDLESAPQRIQREYWVNVYPKHMGQKCDTQQRAKDVREDGCIACVKITIDCEEGDGL